MQDTQTAGPAIVCICALVLGISGIAAGIMLELPTPPAQIASSPASTATPKRDAKPSNDRMIAEHTTVPAQARIEQ